jgi:hypothetical protein
MLDSSTMCAFACKICDFSRSDLGLGLLVLLLRR